MFLPTYALEGIAFAYRCYVYFRCHTYRREPIAALTQLTPECLQAIHPEIHILELTASDTVIALLRITRPCRPPTPSLC